MDREAWLCPASLNHTNAYSAGLHRRDSPSGTDEWVPGGSHSEELSGVDDSGKAAGSSNTTARGFIFSLVHLHSEKLELNVILAPSTLHTERFRIINSTCF
jgi:hypothetical protein